PIVPMPPINSMIAQDLYCFIWLPMPPRSPVCPYTTLFRSRVPVLRGHPDHQGAGDLPRPGSPAPLVRPPHHRAIDDHVLAADAGHLLLHRLPEPEGGLSVSPAVHRREGAR